MLSGAELTDWPLWLFTFVLGTARLAAFLSVAPFMGTSVVTGTPKLAVTGALFLFIAPTVSESVPAIFPLTAASVALAVGLVVKEVFIGFVLAYLAGSIFWAVMSAGFFIDNQRGAGMASGSDPLTAEETSPTGAFFLQSAVYVFFASGMFPVVLGLFFGTYLYWPVGTFLPGGFFENESAALFFGGIAAKIAVTMVLLAAPVVLACLFTDIALGLVNRFASQLNVYVLAMPIKSAVAAVLLLVYFALLMTDAPERFAVFGTDLTALRNFLP